jgi:hypothetical protein
MSPLNAAIYTTTYLDVQKCYGLGHGYLVLSVEYTEKTTDLLQV